MVIIQIIVDLALLLLMAHVLCDCLDSYEPKFVIVLEIVCFEFGLFVVFLIVNGAFESFKVS